MNLLKWSRNENFTAVHIYLVRPPVKHRHSSLISLFFHILIKVIELIVSPQVVKDINLRVGERVAEIVRSLSLVKSLLSHASHHDVLAKVLHSEVSPNSPIFSLKSHQIGANIIGFQSLNYFPINSITSHPPLTDQSINSDLPNQTIFEIFCNKFTVSMPAEIFGDAFGSFQIVIDLFSIQNIEDKFSTWMHEIFINVVHIVINNDIANPFFFVIIEVLLLFQQILINFIMIFHLLVFML